MAEKYLATACEQLDVQCAEGSPTAKVAGVVYNGGPIRPGGFSVPLVFDLSGMKAKPRTQLLFNHGKAAIGHAEVAIGETVTFTGEAYAKNADAQEFRDTAAAGFPWEMSGGWTWQAKAMEPLPAGKSATVNGRTVEGPALVIRKSSLREISAVHNGADAETHVALAAMMKEVGMNGETAAAANVEIKAAAAEAPPAPEPKAEAAAPPVVDVAAEVNKALAAERARVKAIADLGAVAGFPEAKELAAKCSADGLTVEQSRATVFDAMAARLRASAGQATQPMAAAAEDPNWTPEAAAVCAKAGLPKEEYLKTAEDIKKGAI